MKVLHFISGGDTGGAKTHVLTLLPKLKEIGVDVELLCIMEGVFTQEAQKLNIPVNIILQKKRELESLSKKIIMTLSIVTVLGQTISLLLSDERLKLL